MNRIILKGRLVRNPELKTGGNGNEYCKFTIAVDRRKLKDKEQLTDFFDCTAYGQTGAAISKYMTKGRLILLEGRMESSRYEKDGQKRTNWGVNVETFEFCDSSKGNQTATDSESGMAVVAPDDDPFA